MWTRPAERGNRVALAQCWQASSIQIAQARASAYQHNREAWGPPQIQYLMPCSPVAPHWASRYSVTHPNLPPLSLVCYLTFITGAGSTLWGLTPIQASSSVLVLLSQGVSTRESHRYASLTPPIQWSNHEALGMLIKYAMPATCVQTHSVGLG